MAAAAAAVTAVNLLSNNGADICTWETVRGEPENLLVD